MNIAICDDEKIICEQIRALIQKENADFCPRIFSAGDALLAAQEQFDLVFLDIRMDGGDGIETARALKARDEDLIIIFITALREYVFDAFDLAAFHYLLKPVDEKKFSEVFRRAQREWEKRHMRRMPVFIKQRGKSIALERARILYVESHAKKVEIHTKEQVIGVYASMRELERQLDGGFYRCHRGYLVNLSHIAEYDSESITLDGGARVYLAKEKYRDFVKTYMRYLRSGVRGDG